MGWLVAYCYPFGRGGVPDLRVDLLVQYLVMRYEAAPSDFIVRAGPVPQTNARPP